MIKMNKYQDCIRKGYHDWQVSGVNGSDPNDNELDLFCALCHTEGDAKVNVRNPNDEEDDDE